MTGIPAAQLLYVKMAFIFAALWQSKLHVRAYMCLHCDSPSESSRLDKYDWDDGKNYISALELLIVFSVQFSDCAVNPFIGS